MKLTANFGLTLMAIGVGAQAIDVITAKDGQGGVLFGPSGILTPIDSKVPKWTFPWVNVPTNIAFWLILVGLVIWLWKR